MYSLIKAVAVLNEFIQFLSGIFNHVLMQLDSVVHTERPFERRNHKRRNIFFKNNQCGIK